VAFFALRFSDAVALVFAFDVFQISPSTPRVFFPQVFRHPFDGKSLAAVRVDQQPLQGFRLAMPASLCCLCDTLGAPG